VRLATAITCRADDAEDAAQTAFVKAHAALGRFDATRSFRPWLLRIVANEAKNRRRAAGRRVRLVERAQVMRVEDGRSPEDEVVAGLDAASLVQAISKLDDRDRTVLGYRWFAQMTEAEMATALDCAPGTVKSRLARAMQRLRTELERRPADA
jgi:RNA polymerase sigma-70 factor (ECF subfamily)